MQAFAPSSSSNARNDSTYSCRHLLGQGQAEEACPISEELVADAQDGQLGQMVLGQQTTAFAGWQHCEFRGVAKHLHPVLV